LKSLKKSEFHYPKARNAHFFKPWEMASVLRECDAAAKAFSQKTDSVETIRRIRDERHANL
jgi:hypothetical protein